MDSTRTKPSACAAPHVSHLLDGKAALTPEMSLRIEKAFGPTLDQLLRMQLAYDVAQQRNHEADIKVSRYAPA